MQVLGQRLLAAVVTALCALPAAGATAAPRHHKHHKKDKHRVRLPADYAAWSRVAVCESGGWRVLGSSYPDSLGITATNFRAFGGRPQPPGATTLAERVAQIKVADRLVCAYHIGIPDQSGCAAW